MCLQRGQHGSEGGVRMHLSGVTAPTLLLLKRGVTEDVDGAALQRLRDRAKAGLPEPQGPGVERAHSSVARLYADAIESHKLTFRLRYALLDGRWLVKLFKGMSTEPTSLYDVSR